MSKKGSTKGPILKSTKNTSTKEDGDRTKASREDSACQQRILNIFSSSFDEVLSSDTFAGTLQEVKQDLFNRNFVAAFGTEEKLEVYAARWSPTRALCYASALRSIRSHTNTVSGIRAQNNEGPHTVLKTVSIGGGAAEIVAFGSLLNGTEGISTDITLLDSAPWAEVVSKLENSLTTAPHLSKHASQAVKAANVPLVEPSRL